MYKSKPTVRISRDQKNPFKLNSEPIYMGWRGLKNEESNRFQSDSSNTIFRDTVLFILVLRFVLYQHAKKKSPIPDFIHHLSFRQFYLPVPNWFMVDIVDWETEMIPHFSKSSSRREKKEEIQWTKKISPFFFLLLLVPDVTTMTVNDAERLNVKNYLK